MIILLCALSIMLSLIVGYLIFVRIICWKEMHNHNIKEKEKEENNYD